MSGTKPKRTKEEKVMNMAREKLMKNFDDRSAEPPPYTSEPIALHTTVPGMNAHKAPPSSIPTSEDLNFQSSPLDIPTPTECIAHLKLLHAFAKLRHEVGNHDGLFDIKMETNTHLSRTGSTDDAAIAEGIRDKRWSVYITKAVARFEKWWDLLNGGSVWYRSIRTEDFDTAFGDRYSGKLCTVQVFGSTKCVPVQRFPTHGDGYDDNPGFQLPPLDVLMVWHAYMLSPRIYLEDCVRYTKQTLWRTSFPWETIYKSIDNETLEYRPGDELHFEQSTSCPWDAIQDGRLAVVKCPQCCEKNMVPWTQPPVYSDPETLSVYLTNDNGFAGSEFEHRCVSCGFIITHEKLRVGKFADDAHSLIHSQRPFAGTILNAWGEPAGVLNAHIYSIFTDNHQEPPRARNSAPTTHSFCTASSQ
jgi:predicted RNA-binding Zn-ribbon protein involved in translation (DUF1610 family)